MSLGELTFQVFSASLKEGPGNTSSLNRRALADCGEIKAHGAFPLTGIS
jgi:hypothetical protein